MMRGSVHSSRSRMPATRSNSRGRSAFAVVGVNQEETQGSIDAALTFGLLWLDACREREAGRSMVEGLRLYVPPKTSATL